MASKSYRNEEHSPRLLLASRWVSRILTHNPSLKAPLPERRQGFALVVALVLMAFLVMLILLLSSTTMIEVRSATLHRDIHGTHLQALLTVQVAMGKLYETAGPDQRVTARAEILEQTATPPQAGNKYWTGVWRSDPVDPLLDGQLITWLVSGDSPDPAQAPVAVNGHGPVVLCTGNTVDENVQVQLNRSQGPGDTSYYWGFWVADESVKAKINVRHDLKDAVSTPGPIDYPRALALAQSFPRVGLERLEGFSPLASIYGQPGFFTYEDVLLYPQLPLVHQDLRASLLGNNSRWMKQHYHDVSIVASGLLVDARNGGFRMDLTPAFEQESEFNRLLAGDYIWTHINSDPDRPIKGPTWEYVRDYYQLKDQLKYGANAADAILTAQRPFRREGGYKSLYDEAHTNVWSKFEQGDDVSKPDRDLVTQNTLPVLTHFQVTYSIAASRVNPGPDEISGNEDDSFALRLKVHPVVSLWNPYNTSLELATPPEAEEGILRVEWRDYPQFEFVLIDSLGNERIRFVTSLADIMTQSKSAGIFDWANNYYKGSNNGLRTQTSFKMDIPASEIGTMLPGEVRQFSLDSGVVITPDTQDEALGSAVLVNDWKEDRGFETAHLMMIGPYGPTGPQGPATYSSGLYYDSYSSFKHGDDSPKSDFRWEHWPPAFSKNEPSTEFVYGREGDSVSIRIRSNYEENAFAGGTAHLSDGSKENRQNGLATWLSIKLIEPEGQKERKVVASGIYNIRAVQQDPISYGPVSLGALTALGSSVEHIGGYVYRMKDPTTSSLAPVAQDAALFAQWNPRAFANSGFQTDLKWSDEWDHPGVANWIILPVQSDEAINPQNTNSAGPLQGFYGNGHTSGDGSTSTIAFEIPRAPLKSIGELQHANLSYLTGAEPAYAVGNSYASPLIDQDARFRYDGSGRVSHADTSYLLNAVLWDSYFFSTIPQSSEPLSYPLDPDPDQVFDTGDIAAMDPLPNTRYHFAWNDGAAALTPADLRRADENARHLVIDGPFNVNSTSVSAWEAILSGLNRETLAQSQPKYEHGGITGFTHGQRAAPAINQLPAGRFTLPFGTFVDNEAADTSRWGGQRIVTQTQIRTLAENIVAEIKERASLNGGRPFLSLGEFVNRRLALDDTGLGGAIQSAIDDSGINDELHSPVNASTLSEPVKNLDAMTIPVMAGTPNFLTQADLLRLLGPVMTVRSDTFLIRVYVAQVQDTSNEVIAETWCEAVVQRLPEGDATGRPFRIVHFRWMKADEV